MSPARMKMTGAVSAVLVALVTGPHLLAHHSFATEYDRNKPVSVTGVVKKVEWRNPHIWFYVDVKDERGKVVTWGFSGGPPAFLMRQGIRQDVMKIGDVVKVEGFRARDGSNNASGGRVTFPDGRSVFTASAEDARPD
ncbi:MAG TPA: DUF6152 family protein [Vicinamibacterales bacterium]|nr:DUF6152 family protein [Vicinamibacterales bacterium]